MGCRATPRHFGAPRVEQLSVVSNQPELTIKPLPGNAPAGFSGAVGDFKLTTKVVPATAGVGEPVTWTLTLEGTGNWPEITGLPGVAGTGNAVASLLLGEPLPGWKLAAAALVLGGLAINLFGPQLLRWRTASREA